jgi:hypothetical protein
MATPFQEIVEAIKWKCSNEISQFSELIINYEKDIKDELLKEIHLYQDKKLIAFNTLREEVENLLKQEEYLW